MPSVPVNTLKEFIDYVKAHPGELNYGSSGVGSAHHLSMEAMKAALGLQMTHIPYRGTGQSVPALLGGHVQVLFSAYPSLAGAIADKRVKLLATNGAQPSPQAPDVPPIATVIPGYRSCLHRRLFVRTGTPPAIVKKLCRRSRRCVEHAGDAKADGGRRHRAASEGPERPGQASRRPKPPTSARSSRPPVSRWSDRSCALNILIAAFVALAFAALAWPFAAACPGAVSEPVIRFIVPYAAGGLPDTVARITAQHLQERIGQSVVVENRAGGGAAAAVSALMGAPADGYTFIVTDGSLVSTNPVLFKQLTYNAKDIVPVALLGQHAAVSRGAS